MMALELEAHHARIELKIVGDQNSAAQSLGERWKDFFEYRSELHHSGGYAVNAGWSNIPLGVDQRVVLVLSLPSLGIEGKDGDFDNSVVRAEAGRLDIDNNRLRALCENVVEVWHARVKDP